MNAVLYIAAALSAVCAVLLVIVIMKLNRPSAQDGQIKELEHKVSSLEGQLRDEFERSRRESAGNQKDMRSELTESLDKMNERLALMTEANFKHQQQLLHGVVEYAQLYAGILLDECEQSLAEHGAERVGDAYLKRAGHNVFQVEHVLAARLAGREGLGCKGQQFLTAFGEAHLVAVAVEQLHAKFVFELLDLL